jgi:GPH family glycoside/pentoside/hexuronide:cation symporter
MQVEKLPRKGLIAYGIGCLGWSISINIISVLLNYIYLPPSNAGMNNLIPQTTIFRVFNIIAIILLFGRGFDAIIDPFIAHLSDKSKNKLGRRIPFMRFSFLPMSVFCILLFYPVTHSESHFNIWWLAGIQLLYYFFFGMYMIPYNALLAELGHDAQAKINLSTAQSVGFMLGIVISSGSPMVADLLQHFALVSGRLAAYQYTIVGMNILAAVCMAYPAFYLDEKKHSYEPNLTVPFFISLKTAINNSNFRIFAVADASFFMANAMVTAGLMYYLKAILYLDEAVGTAFMLGMVVITFSFYGVVNRMGTRHSKKKMMTIAFLGASVVFFEIFFLGKFPFSPYIQAGLLVATFGIPDAFLSILPNTVIADIAHDEFKRTGENKEGMFFGMRAFFQKLGQTAGVTVFAMLTLYGKDPGHDFGLRLSGLAGAALCIFAAFAYSRYKENIPEGVSKNSGSVEAIRHRSTGEPVS